MISPLAPSDFAKLYRFSVVLAGLNEEAEHLVHEALEEKLGRFKGDDSRKTLLLLLAAIWAGRPEPLGDAPVRNLPPQFQWTKTQDRAVAALRSFGEFSEPEIATICGNGASDEAGMLPVEKVETALNSIAISPELLKRFEVTVHGLQSPFRLSSALGLSIIFSAIVLLAVAGWIWRDWHAKADEILARKFIEATEKQSLAKVESVDIPVGELGDILSLKYGLENYTLPASFAAVPAAGLGFKQVDGNPVVQIFLKNSKAVLMLFRAEDFGLEPESSQWQTASLDGWAMAIRSQSSQGQVLTLRGTEEELRTLFPK